MAKKRTRPSFVVCVANDSCDDLQVWKLSRVLPDARAAAKGYVRVVGDSGEDYLYSAECFVAVNFPTAVKRRLLAASSAVA